MERGRLGGAGLHQQVSETGPYLQSHLQTEQPPFMQHEQQHGNDGVDSAAFEMFEGGFDVAQPDGANYFNEGDGPAHAFDQTHEALHEPLAFSSRQQGAGDRARVSRAPTGQAPQASHYLDVGAPHGGPAAELSQRQARPHRLHDDLHHAEGARHGRHFAHPRAAAHSQGARLEEPPLSGKFHNDIFKARYQRNNKRGGLKNLRCFPSCGFRHKERGFCGRSVEVELAHGRLSASSAVYSWIEFVKRNDPPPFAVGDTMSLAKAQSMERSKDEPIKPWVRGERLVEKCTDTVSAFEFNKERRGWHYGWASNKHTCNAEHALQCYVFEASERDPGILCCRLIFQSPSFMLFCRRRRRFTLAPSAPTAVPFKRARSAEDGDNDDGEDEPDPVKVKLEPHPMGPLGAHASGGVPDGEAWPPPLPPPAPIQTARSGPPGTGEAPPSVLVSPARRRQFSTSGADSNRLEGIMRRLAVIMGRIQQQQEHEAKQARKPAAGDPWLAGLDQGRSGQGHVGQGPGHSEHELSDMDIVGFFQMLPDMGFGEEDGDAGSSELFAGGPSSDFGIPELAGTDLGGAPIDHDQGGAGSSFEGVGSEEAPLQGRKRSLSDQMLDDVALYMRNESGFSRAVEQLTRQARNATPNYHGFLRLVQEHMDSYRRSRNISRAEFDRVFNKATGKGVVAGGSVSSSAVNNAGIPSHSGQHGGGAQPRLDPASTMLHPAHKRAPPTASHQSSGSSSLLTSAIGAFTSLVSSSSSSAGLGARDVDRRPAYLEGPLYLEGPGYVRVPNIQGRWRQTEESEHAMQDMRNKMGTPWILSKMFEFMESRFEIEVNGYEMITRLNRKWISNTTLKFTLDGELHHWGISLPPPFSQLSQGWTYRAWVEDNKIVLTHMIGDQRVTRMNWVSRDRSVLHSIVILEVLDPQLGSYAEMGRVNQHATREHEQV